MLRRILAWKYAIAVLVISVFFIYVSRQDQRTRSEYEQKCSQSNNGLISPWLSPNEDCDKGAENAARHLPRWYRLFGWSEGITTWAILLTLFAIAEQTGQTRKAAEATQRSADAAFKSVELQEIQYRQWVETGDWEHLTPHIQPTSPQATIAIRFNVGNMTNFPLTLKVVRTKRLGLTDTFAPNTLIAPKEGYPVDFFTDIRGEDLDRFRKNQFNLAVAITVLYEDVLRKDRPQHFLYVIRCGTTRFDITPMHSNAEARYEDYSQD